MDMISCKKGMEKRVVNLVQINDMFVEVERKKIKNLNLRIYPSGKIYLSVPVATSDNYIKEFLVQRKFWIQTKQSELQTKEHHKVRPENQTARQKDEYRKKLQNEIPALIRKWEPIIGVKVGEFRIKDMKTRWGSCNVRDHRIWINLQLARYDKECLEYILVHEMTHLLERGHGVLFKAHMNRFLPNWREIDKKLKQPAG